MTQNPRKLAILLVVLFCAVSAMAQKDSIDALKAKAERESGGHAAKLYMELANRTVDVADQQFTNGEIDAAQKTVMEVIDYARRSTDASASSGKRLKETEIELRKLEARLENLRRQLDFENREAMKPSISKLEDLRQVLLDRMFGPDKHDSSNALATVTPRQQS